MAFYRLIPSVAIVSLLSFTSALQTTRDGDWNTYTAFEFMNYTTSQCEAPFTSANATGTYLVDPNTSNMGMDGVSWTVAVSQPLVNEEVGPLNYSLYLGTPSGMDLRSGSLNYSACALIFEDLSDNLVRRGQDDDGTCTQMLSEECVAALSKQAANTGSGLTLTFQDNSPAPSNLTAGSLSRVCFDIRNAAAAHGAVPRECAQFVGSSMTWSDPPYSNVSIQVVDLTGPNATIDDTCSFATTTLPSDSPAFNLPSSNLSFVWEFAALTGPNNSTQFYDDATQNILPILTVTFPPANDSRVNYSTGSSGYMNCLRTNNIRAGSRVAAPLPAATALRRVGPVLSKGAIAGVAIASVVVVAAVVSLALWWFMRRRRSEGAKRNALEVERTKLALEKEREREEIKKEALQPMADSNQKYEIDGKGGRGEMDSGLVNELEGSAVPELGGSRS